MIRIKNFLFFKINLNMLTTYMKNNEAKYIEQKDEKQGRIKVIYELVFLIIYS